MTAHSHWSVAGLGLIGLLYAGSGAAEPYSYMRKNDPDELYCMASVGDNCPVDNATVQGLIDDVTRRFSLKRLPRSADGEPLFYVELYCHRQETGETAYSVETGFAEWVGGRRQHLMKYAYYPYRTVGYGGAADIRETVRRRIEDALSDYLDANFGAPGAESQ